MSAENAVRIACLADHPDAVPILARWFRDQWPAHYAGQTHEDIQEAFLSEAKGEGLPMRLLAFLSDELVGTIVLRARAIDSLPEFRPGLGGLLVEESYRGRGVGTELARAGMNVARGQGFDMLYATTTEAEGILRRLGWQLVKTLVHHDQELSLYRCDLRG